MNDERTRLTGTSFAVLTLIELLGPSTPYDLKQALEKSIANFWMVPHTTFYAEPTRLASGGFLSEQQEPQLREEGVLKIFAGGDPLPIFRTRVEWHRAKLAELEGYLEAVAGDDPAWDGVRASLQVGVAYNRMMLEAMERFLESQAATGSS
jgi:hypothetical protein